MYRVSSRLLLAVALAAASLAVAVAQERPKDTDDYRRFFRKPENALEFWKAIQFELDVGRPDLAAKHVRALLATKPTDKDLLTIVEKDGLSPVLKLKGIRNWVEKDDKENKQAIKDAAEFVQRVSEAYRKRLQDPERIKGFIDQLKKTEEEKAYAIRELYRSGSYAVPILIDQLSKAAEAEDRLALLDALSAMDPGDSLAPMIAALDSDNARLKLDLLEIIRKKHGRFAPQVVPHLWYPSANPNEDRAVRLAARKLNADFQDVPESRLTPAKTALTREAERFYQKKMNLGDPKAVGVWRWDDKAKEVRKGWPGAETITADQANEYWGLRFARQALSLDPTYRPAQVVFLGLAIQSRPGPETADLVAKASPELLIEVLERGLKEQRRGEILATLAALRDRAEVRAKRPSSSTEAALVRALYYPDPRVQMTAVEALLVIPGKPMPKTALRIIEILGGQLTPLAVSKPGRRVLVAIADPDWRVKVQNAVERAGAEPIAVGNGRDAMRQLRAHADVDAILLDSTLPNPGLANLLAQMRIDVDFGRVPILLAAIPETRSAHDLAACSARLQARLELINADTRVYRASLKDLESDEAADLKKLSADKDASRSERSFAERSIRERYDQLRRRLDLEYLDASRLAKDAPKLEAKQRKLAERYDAEARVREAQLERFTSRYQNVRVVNPSALVDARVLEPTLAATIREAGVALTQEQRAENAEIAIQILSNLAQGRPAGYDVRPATDNILSALRAKKLSPRGQIAACDAAARLPGSQAQVELLSAMGDGGRPVEVRIAAGEGLVQSLQRFGLQLSRLQVAAISELAKEPKIDTKLKAQVNLVIGALRLCDKKTGELLRQYNPQPVAPIPPPDDKDKKDKDKEKKADEEKKDKKDEKKDKEKKDDEEKKD